METETDRDKFRISDIVDEGVRLGRKRLKAEDLLSWAEKGKLPLYVGLPVTSGDKEKGQGSFVRIRKRDLTGTTLEPTTLINVEYGELDLRYKADDKSVWTPEGGFIKVGLGEVRPLDCIVFLDDLDRLGVVYDPLPAMGASDGDEQDEATADSPSLRRQSGLDREERALLCKIIFALSRDWARTKGTERYAAKNGRLIYSAMAKRLEAWLADEPYSMVLEEKQLDERFRKALSIGARLIKGDEGEADKISTGKITLKEAARSLVEQLWPGRDESEALISAKIIDRLRGAGDTSEISEAEVVAVIRRE